MISTFKVTSRYVIDDGNDYLLKNQLVDNDHYNFNIWQYNDQITRTNNYLFLTCTNNIFYLLKPRIWYETTKI